MMPSSIQVVSPSRPRLQRRRMISAVVRVLFSLLAIASRAQVALSTCASGSFRRCMPVYLDIRWPSLDVLNSDHCCIHNKLQEKSKLNRRPLFTRSPIPAPRSFLIRIDPSPDAGLLCSPGNPSVTTSYCAGALSTTGAADGAAASATFNELWSLSRGYPQADGSYALLVGSKSPSLRVITQQCSQVGTLVGVSSDEGFVNGAASAARFGAWVTNAVYLANGASQQIFLTSAYDHAVRVVQMQGAVPQTVQWIAGGSGGAVFGSGSRDGTFIFRFPFRHRHLSIGGPSWPGRHFCLQMVVHILFFACFVSITFFVSCSGIGTNARFNTPTALLVDTTDSALPLYITDKLNHVIRKLVYDATTGQYTVTTVAGSGAAQGVDGVGTLAAFHRPTNFALYTGGGGEPVTFVGEENGCRIRRMGLRSFNVITIAGSSIAAGACAYVNGVGTASRFGAIYGIAVVTLSGFPLLFVTDFANRAIRMIDLGTLNVTTIVGQSGAAATYLDGSGASAVVRAPSGLVIVDDTISSAAGNVTLAFSDQGFTRVRRMALQVSPVCATQITCDTASASAVTTESCVICPAGSFSAATNSTACTTCPIGSFCPQAGGVNATVCTPGSFCGVTGVSAVSGPCAAGFFCPSGSSSALQVACPAGAFHCPAGASVPLSIACAAGYVWF
jgi:hypothetical protein